ncbi:MAG TPA: pilin [Candidatus Dojkabacteria bacterium]|nr:pilin [Candidatus Dojkabacteria bacterium]HQA87763.1 pilin [Candidatus Dojkabacteria bacterium]
MKFVVRILSVLFSSPVFAQEDGLVAPGEPPRLEVLLDSLSKIISFIFPIGVLAAVGMTIYGGYLWMTSGGEPDKKKRAQGTLTWSIAGLAFLYLIKMLLSIVVDTITKGEITL